MRGSPSLIFWPLHDPGTMACKSSQYSGCMSPVCKRYSAFLSKPKKPQTSLQSATQDPDSETTNIFFSTAHPYPTLLNNANIIIYPLSSKEQRSRLVIETKTRDSQLLTLIRCFGILESCITCSPSRQVFLLGNARLNMISILNEIYGNGDEENLTSALPSN